MKTVGFHTFGCKLNFSETSSISREFTDNGYKKKSIYDNPNKVIINTCSVTENADKKCQDLIRKIKRKSPDSEITVVGCFAQLKPIEIINIKLPRTSCCKNVLSYNIKTSLFQINFI